MNKLREKIAKEANMPIESVKCCPYCGTPFQDENACAGCKVYAALQRYHRSQEQCPDCKGCIRIATDRYQKVSE